MVCLSSWRVRDWWVLQKVQNDQQRYGVFERRLSWSREAKANMMEEGLDM